MVNKELTRGEIVIIDGCDAHHISDVLRLKQGNWIVISDGMGGRWGATVEGISKGHVTVNIAERLPDIKGTGLSLAVALIKHDRLEAVIQKAVELGVTNITPFTSERTIPKYSENVSAKKLIRWNRIAVEAAKQCGLPFHPIVEQIHTFDSICHFEPAGGGRKIQRHKILFYEGEKKISLKEYFDAQTPKNHDAQTIIIIGPEGGFTDAEVSLARKNGFVTVGLGPLIMRVETAAIAAVTLTQYFLGHFKI